MNLRTLLERLGRGRTLKRSIDIGDRKASIIVSPDAQLKYLKPGKSPFDQDLIEIARCCLGPQDVVWDIGANVGVFSVAAAICAKSVVAVEADVWLAGLVQRTAALSENAQLDIKVVPVALSDKMGVSEFQIAMRGRASNALAQAGGRSQMGGVRETVYVPTLSLDTLSQTFDAPDFIKIDVEGAEWMVVSGGVSMFSTNDPVIYIEVGCETRKDIFDFFEREGYLAHNSSGDRVSSARTDGANVFFARPSKAQRLSRLSERGA